MPCRKTMSKRGLKKLKITCKQICSLVLESVEATTQDSEMRMRLPMSENVFISIPHNLLIRINGTY
jgi:hypothetical protein